MRCYCKERKNNNVSGKTRRLLREGNRDNVDDIATRYALDSSGFEPRWGEEIFLSPHPFSGPPSLVYSGCRFSPGG